ncbi:MAG: class I SAM-dependent methyltransferase [Chloroflexota bacterium]
MPKAIRQFAKKAIPKPILINTWERYCRRRAQSARAVFEAAGDDPAWLGLEELAELQAAYPLEPMTYKYDDDSLAQRGRERANEMLALVGKDASNLQHFLDLGMWDGMACYALQQMGKQTVGIDIRVEGITPVAATSGAQFAGMDASQLGFPDDTFDFIFSYNSFEHFPEPDKVLQEATRVVRPGGYIYLNFGPLWLSARGAHQFQVISVPYCECLFTKDTLTQFAEGQSIELMGFFWMNEWPLTRYRQLWETVSSQLERVAYYETFNADHVDLISRYPTCFRHKTRHFDDLIVSNIEVLFRKRQVG